MPDPGLEYAPAARAAAPVVTRRGWRLATVVASHPVVDAYAGFVPPILGLLQVRCGLSAWQTASLLSIGPITSGLCQPFFAWLADRTDSRALGALGLAVAAMALSMIGLAGTFGELVIVFAIGMLGVGAFHPVAAASVGQLAGTRRSVGVTLFFVAGMAGATIGPLVSSRIASIEPDGFARLRWAMVPGIIVAVILYGAVRRVSHHHHEERHARFEAGDIRQRWWTVGLLFAGNACRFSVNIALFYVYVRWAEHLVRTADPSLDVTAVATRGAIYCGELNALTMFGMGVGGLVTGMLVRPGRERAVFIAVPLLFAPAIALFPLGGRVTGYALAMSAGIAYASVIPLSIALAQRLLPHRTSLASSLMMGGAWTVAALAPPAAQWSIGRFGLGTTFGLIATLLAFSGALGILLPRGLVQQTGQSPAQGPLA